MNLTSILNLNLVFPCCLHRGCYGQLFLAFQSVTNLQLFLFSLSFPIILSVLGNLHFYNLIIILVSFLLIVQRECERFIYDYPKFFILMFGKSFKEYIELYSEDTKLNMMDLQLGI